MLKRIVFIKLIFLLISSCSYEKKFDSSYYCRNLKLSCFSENRTVTFKTSKGDLEVELFGVDNPVTVSNFIRNIKNNIYANQKFYKIINFPQSKVIHSGINPSNNDYLDTSQMQNKLPPFIPLEIGFKKKSEPKYKYQINDTAEIDKVKKFFQKGSLAMVKSGEVNSSSTEFFFVTNSLPALDGRYAIFGEIVKGIEILDKLEKKDFIYEIKILN